MASEAGAPAAFAICGSKKGLRETRYGRAAAQNQRRARRSVKQSSLRSTDSEGAGSNARPIAEWNLMNLLDNPVICQAD
jgi:hypothetical protein